MRIIAVVLAVGLSLGMLFPMTGIAGDICAPRHCVPERPIPPESVGSIGLPFDIPIWPTLLKTEFNILPWISFKKTSICFPGSCKSLEFTAPSLSLEAIPIWIPWLRPLDIECRDKPYVK